MTSELDVLISKIPDDDLRAAIADNVRRLQRRRTFGLVFEDHLPERVRLPTHPIRRGASVVRRDDTTDEAWTVTGVHGARASLAHPLDGTISEAALEDLVVLAEFGQPIHPGLRHVGSVRRAPDGTPAHTVVKGENHHVLDALRFTHAGKVDCIYIDPPYNTGAKDWKYDNDYVDETDAYRHSKWLAFMLRRLRLAKTLLNPERSALIVTIDARECLRLGMLLEQLFPTATIQMVSIVMNPSGAGNDGINRVDEYAYFVLIGQLPTPTARDDLLNDVDATNPRIRGGLSWESFLRSGTSWYRASRPNLCYPILIDEQSHAIVGVGDPFTGDDEAARPLRVSGMTAAWPVRSDGRLGIWRADSQRLLALASKGYVHVSRYDRQRSTFAMKYLLAGTVRMIESGAVEVERTGAAGQVVAMATTTIAKAPKRVSENTCSRSP